MQACQRHWTAGGLLRKVESSTGKRISTRRKVPCLDESIYDIHPAVAPHASKAARTRVPLSRVAPRSPALQRQGAVSASHSTPCGAAVQYNSASCSDGQVSLGVGQRQQESGWMGVRSVSMGSLLGASEVRDT